jgi:hypothetical protein
MRATLMLMIGAAVVVCGCGRQQIYSKQSVPISLAVASRSGRPAFVGRWAATRADCARSPWILTPTELDTPGRTHCSFAKLSPASAGYAADVACSGSGAEQIGRITLTLTGQRESRGLTLAGGPFTLPVALTPCPALAAG